MRSGWYPPGTLREAARGSRRAPVNGPALPSLQQQQELPVWCTEPAHPRGAQFNSFPPLFNLNPRLWRVPLLKIPSLWRPPPPPPGAARAAASGDGAVPAAPLLSPRRLPLHCPGRAPACPSPWRTVPFSCLWELPFGCPRPLPPIDFKVGEESFFFFF